MKELTKVRIINWHYFWNETIDIKPIVFLTGPNGSGKSTLIDAMQVVLLGDTTGKNFNKAAMDKSNRTLKGYLRGELGDTIDGGFKYLRDGRFTSYIALEYHDDTNDTYFVMGVVFDSFTDGTEEHHFFCLENSLPENGFVENNIPMDYKTLLAYFNQNYLMQFTFFDSNKQYKEFLKRKFGGLKDKYFSLLKKATSFTPITEITSFITDYVCDQQKDINLDVLQDNILQYKKLENEAKNIEKRVNKLEEIQRLYDVYEAHKENLSISNYIVERCSLEQSYNKLRLLNNQIDRNSRRIDEIDEELEDFAKKLTVLENKKARLIADRASNDTERAAQNLRDEKIEVQNKIDDINREVANVKFNLSKYIDSFGGVARELLDNVSGLNLNTLDEDHIDEINELLKNAKTVINVGDRFKETYFDDFSKLQKDELFGLRDTLIAFKSSIGSVYVTFGNVLNKLEKKIESLREVSRTIAAGEKPYDNRLLRIKSRLEAELEQQFGEKIEVSIFADLVDIDDLSWANAIEGLMNPHKFNLFVAPKYYNATYKILRRLLTEESYYATALVDEEKILNSNPECFADSLAEEIVTTHEGARAYANFFLGKVHKSKDPIEARESLNGVTKECDLYRNYALTKINPGLYRDSFIGRKVDNRIIKQNKDDLRELVENFDIYRTIHGLLVEANKLDVLNISEIESISEDLNRIGSLAGLFKTLEYVTKELENGNSPLMESLDARIKDVEADINTVTASKERIILEKGNLETDINNIRKEKIVDEQRKVKDIENSINSNYDPVVVAEKAAPLFETELEEHTIYDLIEKYNVESSHLSYIINNVFNQVVRQRRDYCSDYHLSYDYEDKSNQSFFDELVEYRDVKLPEYKEKINDAYEKATRQFRADFIYKLREAIGEVEDQIENLNGALKQSSFGRDLYRFTVKPSEVYRRYYDMLKDDLILDGDNNDEEFINKYKDTMEDLFRQIVDVGDGEKNDLLIQNVEKFTDYRSYLDFDLVVYNKETGDEQRLSKMMRKKSGGETQTPFYISILASFAQLYRANEEGELGNTTRLIIFDEAFSKMDRNRMTEAVKLLRMFNLQAILSAPSEKVPDMTPLVDETLTVLHTKNQSIVKLFGKQ